MWSYKTSYVAEDVESDQFRIVEGKVFRSEKGLWVDAEYRSPMEARKVDFLSDEYFSLLRDDPAIGHYLALGEELILVLGKDPIRITNQLSASK